MSEFIELSDSNTFGKNGGKLRVIVVPLFATAKLRRTIKKIVTSYQSSSTVRNNKEWLAGDGP